MALMMPKDLVDLILRSTFEFWGCFVVDCDY